MPQKIFHNNLVATCGQIGKLKMLIFFILSLTHVKTLSQGNLAVLVSSVIEIVISPHNKGGKGMYLLHVNKVKK